MSAPGGCAAGWGGGAWAAPNVAPDQRTRLVTMRLREGRGSTNLAHFLLAEEEDDEVSDGRSKRAAGGRGKREGRGKGGGRRRGKGEGGKRREGGRRGKGREKGEEKALCGRPSWTPATMDGDWNGTLRHPRAGGGRRTEGRGAAEGQGAQHEARATEIETK